MKRYKRHIRTSLSRAYAATLKANDDNIPKYTIVKYKKEGTDFFGFIEKEMKLEGPGGSLKTIYTVRDKYDNTRKVVSSTVYFQYPLESTFEHQDEDEESSQTFSAQEITQVDEAISALASKKTEEDVVKLWGRLSKKRRQSPSKLVLTAEEAALSWFQANDPASVAASYEIIKTKGSRYFKSKGRNTFVARSEEVIREKFKEEKTKIVLNYRQLCFICRMRRRLLDIGAPVVNYDYLPDDLKKVWDTLSSNGYLEKYTKVPLSIDTEELPDNLFKYLGLSRDRSTDHEYIEMAKEDEKQLLQLKQQLADFYSTDSKADEPDPEDEIEEAASKQQQQQKNKQTTEDQSWLYPLGVDDGNAESLRNMLVKLQVVTPNENLIPFKFRVPMRFAPEETQAAKDIIDKTLSKYAGTSNKESSLNSEKESDSSALDEDLPRWDLTHLTCFAIDSSAANEVDDAISVEEQEDGSEWFYVHIADPTHFIEPHSILDETAKERSSAIYLPDQQIPMLPRELTDFCGLGPLKVNHCLTFAFQLQEDGAVTKYKVGTSVIGSVIRITPQQTTAEIQSWPQQPLYLPLSQIKQKQLEQEDAAGKSDESKSKPGQLALYDILKNEGLGREIKADEYSSHLKKLHDTAELRRQYRLQHGAVIFHALDEVKVTWMLGDQLEQGGGGSLQPIVDGSNKSLWFDAKKKGDRLVEEFMLTAGEVAANFSRETKLDLIYKTQQPPEDEATFWEQLNGLPDLETVWERKEQEEFNEFRHKNTYERQTRMLEFKNLVFKQTAALTKLRSARRELVPGRHFGLGLGCYTQVTSPLRRYVDLVAHWQIKARLNKQIEPFSGVTLSHLLRDVAEKERKIKMIVSSSTRHWMIIALRQRIGKTVRGVVTNVRSTVMSGKIMGNVRGTVLLMDYSWSTEMTLPKNVKEGDVVKVKVAAADVDKEYLVLMFDSKEAFWSIARKEKRERKESKRREQENIMLENKKKLELQGLARADTVEKMKALLGGNKTGKST